MSQYFEMKDRFDRSYEESQSFNYHNQFSQESYADQNKRKELMKIYQKYGNIGCILNNQTETTTYTKSKAGNFVYYKFVYNVFTLPITLIMVV